jgi:hypothetical protein
MASGEGSDIKSGSSIFIPAIENLQREQGTGSSLLLDRSSRLICRGKCALVEICLMHVKGL